MTRQMRRQLERQQQKNSNEVQREKVTTNNKLAQKVIDTFPSFDEMIDSDTMKVCTGNNNMWNTYMQDCKGKWFNYEPVAKIVQGMVSSMMGDDWYKWYNVRGKNYQGTAVVTDHMNQEYEVSGVMFIALIKIMFSTYTQYWGEGRKYATEAQMNAMSEFKGLPGIWNILD